MNVGATAASGPQLIFAALADPTRRDLVSHLASHSPKTATQLAAVYPITRQGILKHLSILQDAGLVVVQQQGRDKRYVPRLQRLSELERWIRDLTAKWDANLLRLKQFAESQPDDEE